MFPWLTARLLALLLLPLLAVNVSGGLLKGGADFEPENMGWRVSDFQFLTNISREISVDQVRQFREAAGKGDPKALLNLAALYERGLGVPVNATEAAKLVREAASQGFAPAQNHLGLYLSAGFGVQHDAKEALAWWSKAAAQSYGPAEYLVGYCFLNGEGVATNFAVANEWFRKAADHNVPAGMHNLAVSYTRGRAVPTNIDEAIRLFRRAADLGSYKSATAAAAFLVLSPSPAKVAEGVRLARWCAENN